MSQIGLNTNNEFLVWKIQDRLSIEEAVMLMCGLLPEGEHRSFLSSKHKNNWPQGVLPLVRLICSAVESEKVKGEILHYKTYDSDGEVDISDSFVEVESLATFLRSKKIVDGFFNDTVPNKVEYLDPQHPCFAPKLAAAVMAWQNVALSSTQDKKPGSPKQRLEKWLREHAARLGLSDKDGNPNQQGIDDVAKVANWQLQGGASSTPSHTPVETEENRDGAIHIPQLTIKKPKKISDEAPFDDEIPF